MTKVGIVGATAYTSLELIKILLGHPEVEISYLGTRKNAGVRISEIFPVLKKIFDMPCSPISKTHVPKGVDLVFATLPPTVSMQFVPQFLDAGIKVVDLSADYRFPEKSVYEKWYKAKHTDPSRLGNAVYGLPELFRDKIKAATLVANPGCYPTSAIIGLAPLIQKDLIYTDDIVIDAKSGISGSGREPKESTHYCERNENLEAYNVGIHRHTPEIEGVISSMGNLDSFVYFTPHLIPMTRGLLCSIYVQLKRQITNEEIRDLFNDMYGREPFIRLSTEGTFPKTKDVANTNMCEISAKIIGKRAIVFSSIDNLMKGASGQAVQNMNIMCNHTETMGLF